MIMLVITIFCQLKSQNREGILPVATLSVALYVTGRFRLDRDVTSEVAILQSALYTSMNNVNFQEPQG